MKLDRQSLDLALEHLPEPRANRIRLFRLVLATAGQLRAELDRTLAPSGVTSQQAALLHCIEAHGTPPTLGEVASTLSMTHQNAKQIASALERKGFLRIEVDEADRRARRLVLTEHHRRFWQARNPGDFDGVERWTSALSDDEVAQLVPLMRRWIRTLR